MRIGPIALLCILLSSLSAHSQHASFDRIKVGLLRSYKPSSMQAIVRQGAYSIWADGRKLGELKVGERITVIGTGGPALRLQVDGKEKGQFEKIDLRAFGDSSTFWLYLLKPSKKEGLYDDDLLISQLRGSVLKLVNHVALEKYIAGVVEAETGKEKGLEFYKVQAIISRTYALDKRGKYARQGFNLSDEVDCQVYHGKARWEPEILKAVLETEGHVLVDSDMNLITAAFHSNSGGETLSSEAVWSGALPYLSPRRDDFSLKGEHANWQLSVHRDEWLGYLSKRWKLDTVDPLRQNSFLNWEQSSRERFLIDPSLGIPLKEVRKDWQLNSTFFDLSLDGDSVHISGRGFGHGTGLSQEGAMRMAALGFDYKDILHFYYNDVHLIDLRALEFFREE